MNITEKFTVEALYIWKTAIEDWISLGKVHIVHYENVLERRIVEIRKILNFLDIPIQNWRLDCVKYCNVDMYLRKNRKKPKTSPYSRFLKNLIWKNINEVNDMLTRNGHEQLPLDKYTVP